jgi:hypothetical protein
MSLDIVILGQDGRPAEQVSLGVDDHHRLMQFASEHSADLLLRLNDYYSDSEFRGDELSTLIAEAESLRSRCKDNQALRSFLSALVELARLAQAQEQPLLALAD